MLKNINHNFLNIAYLTMVFTVALSNFLVQFPLNEWLTWGAFTYPITFLINELTNRIYGPKAAKSVVYSGFLIALLISACIASLKIAAASAAAFLISQLLDIQVYNKLRSKSWWYAPFYASLLGSLIDTAIFWSLAFWGEDVPVFTWALGDFGIKVIIDLICLTPFRIGMRYATEEQLTNSL